MQLYNNATKAVEEVPDEQAQDAFTSGSHAFIHPDQPVPVKLADGTIGTVSASEAQQALEGGATIVPQAEYHAAHLDHLYGGIGGALEATGEGVARGLSLGLTDPLAIGAARARHHHKLARVAIVDFDVHHGNGTQAMFEDDPNVFFASTHQSPLYPGTGASSERGVGNVVNMPLRPMSGSAEFRQAMSGATRAAPAVK